jgi:hypothetical protein
VCTGNDASIPLVSLDMKYMLDMVYQQSTRPILKVIRRRHMSEEPFVSTWHKETCRIFWDHYHLNKAWQEHSDNLFTELQPDLNVLLNAHFKWSDFDKAKLSESNTLCGQVRSS